MCGEAVKHALGLRKSSLSHTHTNIWKLSLKKTIYSAFNTNQNYSNKDIQDEQTKRLSKARFS